jgi:hypothetical protein
MKYTAATDDTPARAYSRLLLRLHDLIAKGQGDDPEADAVRDQMDAPWYAMTDAEQERVGGLSEDLYALAENNPRAVRMPAEERRQWGQEFGAAFAAGDWDRALVLLRRPPDDVPAAHVAFFQADCWEHLGCPEVALRFMRSATRLDTAQAVSVLTLWFPREVG